jgi:hypothetical protein
MTSDLTRLLQETVPEPPRLLDPGAVLHRARRRRRVRATALLAAAAVLLVGVAAGALQGPWRHRAIPLAPTAVPLTVSALAHLQPLSPESAEALDGEGPLAHPGQATLVGTLDRSKVWLAATADDQLCLLVAHDEYGQQLTGCAARKELLRSGLLLAYLPGEDPAALTHILVVAPDGYTAARGPGAEAAFTENTAVLTFARRPPPDTDITISGAGLPDVTFPLEPVVGPGPAPAGTDPAVHTARQDLLDIARSARLYAQDHGGSTTGFVASLPPDFTAVLLRTKIAVTDTTASTSVHGHCLSVEFATGTVTDRGC